MRSKALKVGVAVFLIFLIGAYVFFFLRNMNRASFTDGVLTVKGVRYEMAAIPAGVFVIGAKTGLAQERPAQGVRIGGFWLGKTEVSQRLWRAVTGHVFSQTQRNNDDPVLEASREDCLAFIDRLNEMSEVKFRLPSATEWEYASRGLRLAADRVPGSAAVK